MPPLKAALVEAAERLSAAGVENALQDAEWLLLAALGQPRSFLYAHPEAALTAAQAARFAGLVERRAAREPLQYILGKAEFCGHELVVTPAVLIPRPETELVVATALELWPEGRALVDVGTGSGCIAIALALARPEAEVTATDVSAAALAVAALNARRLGARVHLEQRDLLEGAGRYAMVVSNPPYVPEAERAGLAPEVRDHEPHGALFAGDDGLAVYRRLISQAAAHLEPGGWLVLELGHGSADGVRELLREGWGEVTTRRDAQGWERVLVGRVA